MHSIGCRRRDEWSYLFHTRLAQVMEESVVRSRHRTSQIHVRSTTNARLLRVAEEPDCVSSQLFRKSHAAGSIQVCGKRLSPLRRSFNTNSVEY